MDRYSVEEDDGYDVEDDIAGGRRDDVIEDENILITELPAESEEEKVVMMSYLFLSLIKNLQQLYSFRF